MPNSPSVRFVAIQLAAALTLFHPARAFEWWVMLADGCHSQSDASIWSRQMLCNDGSKERGQRMTAPRRRQILTHINPGVFSSTHPPTDAIMRTLDL
jgi:hypothetical protein